MHVVNVEQVCQSADLEYLTAWKKNKGLRDLKIKNPDFLPREQFTSKTSDFGMSPV